MISISDGRNELYQWDTGSTLTVDADCSQVHFSNKVFGRSIDVDVVDGVAIIPDVLLQTDKDLIAWAFVGTAENGYTKISKTFKVNRRNKPADYVFTPTDQTSLEEIKEKLDYLESIQDPDAIKNAVEDYLEQNPVEAPVQSVNGKTGAVKLTADDVGAISQDDLQEATNKALAQAKESGEFDGKDGEKGDKGDTGAPGADGYSPTAKVTQTATGATVTITDKTGTTTATITNGKDGKDGADGYTPQKGVDYFDGEPGKDGEDGYTPVKGVDYFDGKDGAPGADGKNGTTPAFSIGTVTTLAAGSSATASITGTTEKPVLNLGIPQGQPGEGGGSGGGTGGSAVSDFTLVGEALLEEDADTIMITLSKECEHIILAYLPYGSASVTNTSNLAVFFYPNPNEWKNQKGHYCMAAQLPNHRFDGNTAKYGCAYGEFIINGNLLVGKMREHTAYLLNMDEPLNSKTGKPTYEYTYDLNTLKTKTADKLVSIRLQVWHVAWGAGTHIKVYGR